MSSIGILIVSHSKNIAQGVVDLISEVAKEELGQVLIEFNQH